MKKYLVVTTNGTNIWVTADEHIEKYVLEVGSFMIQFVKNNDVVTEFIYEDVEKIINLNENNC